MSELYNVSGSGLEGGLSRALVLANFPLALVAIGTMLVALGVLERRWWVMGAPAIVLCALVAWPGVVDQDDLDARLVNALPALGVALALVLTIAATARAGASVRRHLPGDGPRAVVAAAVVLVSLPWLSADLGLHLPGGIFLTDEVVTLGGESLAAVHLGHHHGLDGALLVVTGLLLSRVRTGDRRLQAAQVAYLAAMLAYGAVNLAQDAWLEQVVKRDWADWRIPDALRPDLAPVWLVMIGLAGLCAWALRAEWRAAQRQEGTGT